MAMTDFAKAPGFVLTAATSPQLQQGVQRLFGVYRDATQCITTGRQHTVGNVKRSSKERHKKTHKSCRRTQQIVKRAARISATSLSVRTPFNRCRVVCLRWFFQRDMSRVAISVFAAWMQLLHHLTDGLSHPHRQVGHAKFA
jgi:hypothetical protein